MRATELRQAALDRMRTGELTPDELRVLADDREDLIADLVELPYGEADLRLVDRVRQVALDALGSMADRSRTSREA